MVERHISIPSVVEPQYSPYRHVIDPDGSLPALQMRVHDFQKDTGADGSVAIRLDFDTKFGRMIAVDGTLTLGITPNTTRSSSSEAFFETVVRSRRCKEPGVGLATYLLATEFAEVYGAQMTTGRLISTRAVKMWDRLVTLGIAEIIEPFVCVIQSFKMYEGWPPDDFYSGKARVLSPERLYNPNST